MNVSAPTMAQSRYFARHFASKERYPANNGAGNANILVMFGALSRLKFIRRVWRVRPQQQSRHRIGDVAE
jgi:hypothetical protein